MYFSLGVHTLAPNGRPSAPVPLPTQPAAPTCFAVNTMANAFFERRAE